MKRLELTPRLQAVADWIPAGSRLADIGTDHAYLPVWLLNEGIVSQAIAADLREGPLERARMTAHQYACSTGLSFRLCDGLEGIAADEADTIVMAGMGGETIAAILERASWTADEKYTLIFQPMSAQPELRRWLWTNGFDLQKEQIVREGEKLYHIFLVRYGGAVPMTLGEEWAGRQSAQLVQPLRSLFLKRLLQKVQRAVEGISRGKGERDSQRLRELMQVRQELEWMNKEWEAWQR